MAAALQERETRLIRGERLAAIGRLAAQVTHEIRNPLSSVALNVELLEDELDGATPEARTLLARITGEVDRLAAITEEYPRLRPPAEARASAHRISPPSWSHSSILWRRSTSRPASSSADRSSAQPSSKATPSQLRRAPHEPPTQRQGGPSASPWAAVRPASPSPSPPAPRACASPSPTTAPGNPRRPSESASLRPFTPARPRGTGLGLAIVQQIVSDHEGTIRVARSGPEGTVFELTLPACAPMGAPVSSPGPA
jgi:two-component system NtrC family sensor kinase